MRAKAQLRALNRIGMELMHEHDLPLLLGRILTTAKVLTSSDGGGLFLVDTETDTPALALHHFDFDSLAHVEATRVRVPLDGTSLAAHAARTKRSIVVHDAYRLVPNAEFVLDRSFDERHQYRRRSLLFVPMVDHLDHLVGLLLLVNKKSDTRARLTDAASVDRYVRRYSRNDVDVAQSLAGQAAVAIENAQLYARIERTLESFVEAAVTAIDERDPATAGHSRRVAELCTSLARAVDAMTEGPYRDVHFSAPQMRELHFAALLHDIGKVAVPEHVLLKAKKLPPVLWERVTGRFAMVRAMLQLDCGGESTGDGDSAMALEALEGIRQTVARANEPSILESDTSNGLADIASRRFRGPDGSEMPYLTGDELHFLALRRGTLDDEERALVEDHAEASYRLLRSVLWTDDLKDVATYAYGHHEKLDGTGYPRHLRAADIPLPAQIIGLCDMYDALTQADRPYKGALSREQALDVLRDEAEAGRFEGDLVRIMSLDSVQLSETASSRR
jgi:HD-GYP domain-containing protein (c-di-GMP phosphodiesterase class II)